MSEAPNIIVTPRMLDEVHNALEAGMAPDARIGRQPADIDVAELRRLLAEATVGPWLAGEADDYSCITTEYHRVLFGWRARHRNEDTALIVAAVNALPALLDIAEQQKEGDEPLFDILHKLAQERGHKPDIAESPFDFLQRLVARP